MHKRKCGRGSSVGELGTLSLGPTRPGHALPKSYVASSEKGKLSLLSRESSIRYCAMSHESSGQKQHNRFFALPLSSSSLVLFAVDKLIGIFKKLVIRKICQTFRTDLILYILYMMTGLHSSSCSYFTKSLPPSLAIFF